MSGEREAGGILNQGERQKGGRKHLLNSFIAGSSGCCSIQLKWHIYLQIKAIIWWVMALLVN